MVDSQEIRAVNIKDIHVQKADSQEMGAGNTYKLYLQMSDLQEITSGNILCILSSTQLGFKPMISGS